MKASEGALCDAMRSPNGRSLEYGPELMSTELALHKQGVLVVYEDFFSWLLSPNAKCLLSILSYTTFRSFNTFLSASRSPARCLFHPYLDCWLAFMVGTCS